MKLCVNDLQNMYMHQDRVEKWVQYKGPYIEMGVISLNTYTNKIDTKKDTQENDESWTHKFKIIVTNTSGCMLYLEVKNTEATNFLELEYSTLPLAPVSTYSSYFEDIRLLFYAKFS